MIEFARMANVEFNQVPFKGPAEAVQMTHAGQIDFAAVRCPPPRPAGCACRGLFAPARNPAIPAVPTMKEQGFDIAPLSFGALRWARRAAGGGQGQAADGCWAAPTPTRMPVSPGARSNLTIYSSDSAMLDAKPTGRPRDKTAPATALGISK